MSVLDPSTSQIVRFTTAGKVIGRFGARGRKRGRFEQPIGLATDRRGQLYVVDETLNRVTKFAP